MVHEITVTRRTPVQWKPQHSDDRPIVAIMKDGKPVQGIVPERITKVNVDEEVMKLTNAGHIHAWFVRKVAEADETCSSVRVSFRLLDELLADCEKVLFASQLVPAERFSRDYFSWSSEEREAVGMPRKVIKNVNTAHQLLPVSTKYGSSGEYDGQYLADVEETRKIIAGLKAEANRASVGDYYFSASRNYNF